MSGDEFFEAPEEHSVIKSTIVTNYFDGWTRIMLRRLTRPGEVLAYIDLFSGRGRYEDGNPATPLWVLDYAIKDPRLCERLVTIFNDKETKYADQLRTEIINLPGIANLRHQPQVTNMEVGQDVVALLNDGALVPTLFFIDPFGYKGLSLDLIGTAIKSWGCDCIFFFNYNRINLGITNPSVVTLMNDLFGLQRAEWLRQQVTGTTPEERQEMIITTLTDALKEVGGKYVLPFEFESTKGERTSHYIIFVSKAFRGYHLMKEVMFPLSSEKTDVRQFKYVPVRSTQMTLFPDFGKSHSIPLLKEVLMRAGITTPLTVEQVYERISVDTPYTLRNVKDALITLEAEGKVSIDPPATMRPKRNGVVTLADDKIVRFTP